MEENKEKCCIQKKEKCTCEKCDCNPCDGVCKTTNKQCCK